LINLLTRLGWVSLLLFCCFFLSHDASFGKQSLSAPIYKSKILGENKYTMADGWDSYRQKYGKSQEQAQSDAEKVQQGALKAGSSSIGDKLKSAWSLMTTGSDKPREKK
jgi:hypothetical protein